MGIWAKHVNQQLFNYVDSILKTTVLSALDVSSGTAGVFFVHLV